MRAGRSRRFSANHGPRLGEHPVLRGAALALPAALLSALLPALLSARLPSMRSALLALPPQTPTFLLPRAAQAQDNRLTKDYESRSRIPGHYTLGLYTEPNGTGTHLVLAGDQEKALLYLGVSGDSLHSFSGVVFALQLPRGVRLDGPVRWRPIAGLKQRGALVGKGTEVEFNQDCQTQKGPFPVVLGRVPLRFDEGFRQGEIRFAAHRDFGCSVELCVESEWPKPYARGEVTRIERRRTLWDRLRGIFH